MAKIVASTKEKVFQIKRFLGVNECPDGDTNLKMGEASAMQNFRITDDYGLQIRPGMVNVAGLLNSYIVETADDAQLYQTDINTPSLSVACASGVNVSDTGLLYTTGTTGTLDYSTADENANVYFQNLAGLFWQFTDVTLTLGAGTHHVTGGAVTRSGPHTTGFSGFPLSYVIGRACADIQVINGKICPSGTVYDVTLQNISSHVTKYFASGASWSESSGVSSVYILGPDYSAWLNGDGTASASFTSVYTYQNPTNDTYQWYCKAVSAGTNESDTLVRGIWSGYIDGTEYIVAAANGHLWSLTITDGVWSKTDIGSLDTTNGVSFFAFDDKLYMLNGVEYKSWDGTDFEEVVGYRPLIRTEVPYGGGGTTLEQINKLNGLRRVWLSPDGSHATFQLPETGLTSIDYVKVLATGNNMTLTTDYTVDTSAGTVMFTTPPTAGTDTLEVGYTASTNARATVEAMRYAEIFNGTTDNRVFIYGDGSNEAFYSGLDYNGIARADYFPDLNEIKFGDSGTPLTGLIRTYNRLMAFKDNAAFNVSYGPITLTDGNVTAGFYVTPVNKDLGNKALGQVCLVDNRPRTLDAGGIYEWSISNIAGDQLNATRISQRVGTTLLTFDLSSTVTYYDKIHHEYYVLYDGKAIVQNTENDTWYIYDGIDATCMIVYQDEVYFGLTNGYIVHFSRDYMSDNGANIVTYWESGSMDFDASFKRKYSANMWIGIKPEEHGFIRVTVQTDQQDDYSDEEVLSNYTYSDLTGFFSFYNLDFTNWTFNISNKPQMVKLPIKVKKFTYYKLIFSSDSNSATATVTGADIRVRYTGLVR
jgi:hypothetical protein